MKTTKRFAALFIAVLLVCSMIPFVSAANDGSITINEANIGQEYKIYRILDLESYNPAAGAYSYKLSAKWNGFLEYPGVDAYLLVNSLGYVEWINPDKENNGEAAKAFAQLAFSYVKTRRDDATIGNEILPDATKLAAGTPLVFSDLPLGYYLVESTVGAVCSLSTTKPNATVTDKNALPSIDKKVQEDSTLEWGVENTAQIGQTVLYETIITANTGATSYIVHDTMEAGLTFNEHVTVTYKKGSAAEVPVSEDEGKTYSLENAVNGCNECTFHVVFYEPFLKILADYDQIIIRYSATLNENAKVHGDSPKDTNDNIVYLEYGNGVKTEKITTQTKTFKFDLVKTDEDDKVLNGATFRLYYMADSGRQYVGVVPDSDGTYRPAKLGETPVDIPAGQATVKGMDGDDSTVYYLEEITAPAGYNKLKDSVEVVMTGDGNRVAYVIDGVYDTTTSTGVQVENHKGAELPSTGGFGTKMFYLCGGLLTVVAFTHLVTRKRMKNRA